MAKSYDEILKNIVENVNAEDVFDIEELQSMQDEFAVALGIASIITSQDGSPITRPSNFSGLCANYVRQSKKGLKQCHASDAEIGTCAPCEFIVRDCLSAGLVDGGVSFYLGKRHIANWLFGQIRYSDNMMTEEQLEQRARELDVAPINFKNAYLQVTVVDRNRFQHIAQLALIIAKKFSEEAWLKCVHIAEEEYKEEMEHSLQERKEHLEKEIKTDFLTHLLVRNAFEKEIKKLDSSQITPVAVVVADVNNLKLTNDIFGHRFGDQLLSEIAKILEQERFEGFVLGRCGGDEFNVIIPGGNRSAADWYCHRVSLELAKNYNCCIMPSVAFGVGKKDKPDEKIKDAMEIADFKMYSNKIKMKEQLNFIDSVRTVLIGRGILDQEIICREKEMAAAFAAYLNYNDKTADLFVRMTELHNFGMVMLNQEVFEYRFDYKPSIEIRRELSKASVINSKIANLYTEYEDAAESLLSFYENWDGSGQPNELEAEAIPELSRFGRVLCDYIDRTYEPPIGLGESPTEAMDYLQEYAKKIYDPDAVRIFKKFIEEKLNKILIL